jgi:hypothetical protein
MNKEEADKFLRDTTDDEFETIFALYPDLKARLKKALTAKDKDARIKELEGLLKKCEWADRDDYYEDLCCPECGATKTHGHIVNCKLKDALKEG